MPLFKLPLKKCAWKFASPKNFNRSYLWKNLRMISLPLCLRILWGQALIKPCRHARSSAPGWSRVVAAMLLRIVCFLLQSACQSLCHPVTLVKEDIIRGYSRISTMWMHTKLGPIYQYFTEPEWSRLVERVLLRTYNILVQVWLRQKYYTPQVRPDRGFEHMTSRSWTVHFISSSRQS